ncbi:MAG: response regulator transcription factor [Chloroflexi bacterium]|nr:response regulator transcription factor [Chloroflexota bacterium]
MLVHFPVILIIDDDPTILRSLQINLEGDGFEVMTAGTGREALDKLKTKLPDLAVVDLLLPDMHGFELCRKIKSFLDLPMIMLTAVDTEDSIVQGLSLYAEDYVVKPFSYRQLLARIQRILKRTQQVLPQEQVLILDKDMCIDFAHHTATVNSREVGLTPCETRILSILARHPNTIITSQALIDEVWPDGEGDEARLWVNIRRLRRKLETDPDKPSRLITRRRLGYKLVVARTNIPASQLASPA